jgi:hypothetical protein
MLPIAGHEAYIRWVSSMLADVASIAAAVWPLRWPE